MEIAGYPPVMHKVYLFDYTSSVEFIVLVITFEKEKEKYTLIL